MKINEQTISQIIQEGENHKVEFKYFLEPLSLSKSISAFANSDGGIIIVGIIGFKDRIEILGYNYETVKETIEKTNHYLNPLPETNLIKTVVNNKQVVIIEVKESTKTISAYGNFYIRDNLINVKMTAKELSEKLLNTPSEISYLAEILVKQGETINNLHEEIKKSSSIKSKLKDYIIGGIIGAIFGLILTFLNL